MVVAICSLLFKESLSTQAIVEPDWPAGKTNICKNPTDDFIDFEEGSDGETLLSTISGLKFTTSYGIDWKYGDIRTGNYSVYPYGSKSYETNGNFFAWLGTTGNVGRIDFIEGGATYLSALTSTYSGLILDAYDADDNLIATSDWATDNLNTRTFTRLTVEAPLDKTIAYILIHDSGNYWLIDDLCTDAPGVPPSYYKVAELAKEVIGANYLWGGKGYNYHGSYFVNPQEIIDDGYYPYNHSLKKVVFGKGLDCSGLNFWAYNQTYSGGKISWQTCVNEKKCPLYYEGADGQYRGNTEKIEKDELRAGDLLFFSTKVPNIMDHVAMYIGPFTYNDNQYNTIHASGFTSTTTPAFYNMETEKLKTTKPDDTQQFLKVTDYGRIAEFKLAMEVIIKSPANLIITDPDGQKVTIENTMLDENGHTQEVSGMYYMIRDIDGKLEDTVAMPELKLGDYQINIAPKPNALPTDTYTLEVTASGQTIVLAENVPVNDIPRTPYIIRSTETGIIPIIPAFVDFNPDTLNTESKGKYVTTYIELPKNYNVDDIVLESIKLNNQIQPEIEPTKIGDYDDNGISDLMMKFNRLAVQNILPIEKKVKITIAGKLVNDKPFEGVGFVKVILP
ncbi:C40 family peptidase [Candidatus Parcubacteria bacterium]|nr:C40 family peptidase [Candidatus Parcubacteria bacterium]